MICEAFFINLSKSGEKDVQHIKNTYFISFKCPWFCSVGSYPRKYKSSINLKQVQFQVQFIFFNFQYSWKCSVHAAFNKSKCIVRFYWAIFGSLYVPNSFSDIWFGAKKFHLRTNLFGSNSLTESQSKWLIEICKKDNFGLIWQFLGPFDPVFSLIFNF